MATTFHTKLITTDGEEISCTIKSPKLKLVREFRRNQRAFEDIRSQFAEIDAEEKSIDQSIAEVKKAIKAKIGSTDSLDELLKSYNEKRAAIQKLKDANDADVYNGLIGAADMVLNYPNKKDASDNLQRTKEDIDWDNSELTEIRGAIDFFADAASKSSFDSRG